MYAIYEWLKKANWRVISGELFKTMIAVLFASLLMAKFAESYGILALTNFTKVQDILFQIVWMFVILGAYALLDAIDQIVSDHNKKKRGDKKNE